MPHPAEICCVHCHADDFNESHMHARTNARSDPQRSHTHLRMLPPLTTNLRNKRATVHRTRLILGPDEDNKSMSTPPTHRHRGYWLGGRPMRKPCVHVFHVRVTTKKTNNKNNMCWCVGPFQQIKCIFDLLSCIARSQQVQKVPSDGRLG